MKNHLFTLCTALLISLFFFLPVLGVSKRNFCLLTISTVDFFGESLPGAKIEILLSGSDKMISGISNENGIFVSKVPQGEIFEVKVSLDGYKKFSTQVRSLIGIKEIFLNAGLQVAIISAPYSFLVSGFVKESKSKKPIIDALVTLSSPLNRTFFEQTTTDKNGMFKFSLITPGYFTVSVIRHDFKPASCFIELRSSEKETGLEINLNKSSKD